MTSLAGQFLIASPYLPDPNFMRTVVLMVQHDEEGALGLVLTRPIQLTIKELWENVAEQSIDLEDPIYQGGPVEGPLMALHQESSLSEIEVAQGLYFCSQRENIEALIEDNHQPIRMFLGYSGWAPQQLDDEMAVGGWLTLPAAADKVFQPDQDALWKSVVEEVGSNIMRTSLKLKKMPSDPNLN